MVSPRRFATFMIGAALGLSAACDGGPGGPSRPVPLVTVVMPAYARPQAQTEVQIHGAGFRAGMAVLFGADPAQIVTMSTSLVVVRTPVRPAGDVNISVKTLTGERVTFTKPFKFVDAALARVAPNPGLPGMPVGLIGSYFPPDVRVTFGGVNAPIVDFQPHEFYVRVPHHDPGAVDVAVIVPGGPVLTLTNGFTYTAIAVLPSATSVAAGAPMKVSWAVPVGFWDDESFSDSLGLYRVSAPDNQPVWREDVRSATGSLDLIAPAQPGEYEFRYLMDNRTVVVGKAPLVVVAAPSSSQY